MELVQNQNFSSNGTRLFKQHQQFMVQITNGSDGGYWCNHGNHFEVNGFTMSFEYKWQTLVVNMET